MKGDLSTEKFGGEGEENDNVSKEQLPDK